MPTKGALIGEGRTAEIYAWGENQVLKLFHAESSPDSVDYEARIAQIVTEAGISAPAFGGMIEVDGRRGIVYEYVQGTLMLKQLQKQPWSVIKLARQFAEVHAAMHQRSAPALPSQHERLERRILQAPRLSDGVKSRLLKHLERLPTGDTVCHGDFHPENILMSPLGLKVIDWTDAKRGNPMADVARSSIILNQRSLPPRMNRLEGFILNTFRGLFHTVYLKRYAQIRPFAQEDLEAWIPVQAAARLNEGIREEEDHLVQLAEKVDR
jgi:uncharacterized protein (TIGR02172 family)